MIVPEYNLWDVKNSLNRYRRCAVQRLAGCPVVADVFELDLVLMIAGTSSLTGMHSLIRRWFLKKQPP